MDRAALQDRMLRAAKLDDGLYDEVKADKTANQQAVAVVGITSLVWGFGVGFAALIIEGGLGFWGGFLVGLLSSFGGWFIWYFYSYWAGTSVFSNRDTTATYGEFLRTLSFSNSPRMLGFVYFIPFIGWLIALAASVWALIAGIKAVSITFNLSNKRAAAACVTGWIPYMLVVFLVSGLTV